MFPVIQKFFSYFILVLHSWNQAIFPVPKFLIQLLSLIQHCIISLGCVLPRFLYSLDSTYITRETSLKHSSDHSIYTLTNVCYSFLTFELSHTNFTWYSKSVVGYLAPIYHCGSISHSFSSLIQVNEINHVSCPLLLHPLFAEIFLLQCIISFQAN